MLSLLLLLLLLLLRLTGVWRCCASNSKVVVILA
jgi:hypothetical protein